MSGVLDGQENNIKLYERFFIQFMRKLYPSFIETIKILNMTGTELFIDNFKSNEEELMKYYELSGGYISLQEIKQRNLELKQEVPGNQELKDMIGLSRDNMSIEQKFQQTVILREFFKVSKMAEHLFLVQQSTNFDTANLNDQFLVMKKREQFKLARKTIISSADKLLEATFVGMLGSTMTRIREAFSTVTVTGTPPTTAPAASLATISNPTCSAVAVVAIVFEVSTALFAVIERPDEPPIAVAGTTVEALEAAFPAP